MQNGAAQLSILVMVVHGNGSAITTLSLYLPIMGSEKVVSKSINSACRRPGRNREAVGGRRQVLSDRAAAGA